MSIQVAWLDDDQHIIHVVFSPTWTWEDFYQLDQHTGTLINSVTHRVCYLVDLSATARVPDIARIDLKRVRAVLDFRHPNSDWLVLTGINRYIRIMLGMVLKSLGKISTHIIFADTPEQGQTLIMEHLQELR